MSKNYSSNAPFQSVNIAENNYIKLGNEYIEFSDIGNAFGKNYRTFEYEEEKYYINKNAQIFDNKFLLINETSEKEIWDYIYNKYKNFFKKTKPSEIIFDPNKFGEDYHVEYLKTHPVLSYLEVEKQFGIKIQGFGKGINPTKKSIVLISSIKYNNKAFVYHDHWDNGDYIYSGEGKSGNQQMINGNKEIKDAASNKKTIYLFVKLQSSAYYFQGQFKLINYSYEDDLDEFGNLRKEYKFRLRKISN